jgi:hypothetical protein
MTDRIEPALGESWWARLSRGVSDVIAQDGRLIAKGDRDAHVAGIPALSVVPSEEPHAAIAFLNSYLPKSDPRKITREHVKQLRLVAEHLRATDSDLVGETMVARDTLRALADALESYLPPA